MLSQKKEKGMEIKLLNSMHPISHLFTLLDTKDEITCAMVYAKGMSYLNQMVFNQLRIKPSQYM